MAQWLSHGEMFPIPWLCLLCRELSASHSALRFLSNNPETSMSSTAEQSMSPVMDGNRPRVFPFGTMHGGIGFNPMCPYNKQVRRMNDCMFSRFRALQESLSVRFCYRTAAIKHSLELKTCVAPVDIKNSWARERTGPVYKGYRSVKKE